MRRAILALVMLLAAASVAAAQTVFVVRHAERADQAGAQGAHGAPARERPAFAPKALRRVRRSFSGGGSGAQGSPRATEPGSGAEPRQEMMASDPDLSGPGRARAEALASMLKDAGITAIFTTEYKRTRETAAPLAKLLGITPQTVSSRETASLVAKVKSARGNVLVVGHSNTVPDIVEGLGIATPVTIGESDYDNLFVVTLGESPALLRLHFR